MRKRIVTDEFINRVPMAEAAIHDWMRSNNIIETTPDLCIDILVGNHIYKYNSKRNGHSFRKDLRTLRGNGLLETTFKRILVKQKKPGAPWYIEIEKNI
ncbi:hypothetical protein [Desulfosporosinus youngiae]|uniref:Uncharacterized protein n=1 Tax=Desulfosporosinus youngiae DSM 17734 TaxID=768710 RepID=H5Y0S7_9FIRM|nr:hypothetical protein [Desulfosporosinus youngiae]EHQ92333.1 hypothetical protein DesyoDRAFT_5408 [Desulfosporosinus youngiae DSM 17734]